MKNKKDYKAEANIFLSLTKPFNKRGHSIFCKRWAQRSASHQLGQNPTAHCSNMTTHPSKMNSGHNTKQNARCGYGRWWWGHAPNYRGCAPAIHQHRRQYNHQGVLRRKKQEDNYRRAMQLRDLGLIRYGCDNHLPLYLSNRHTTLMWGATELLEPPIYSESAFLDDFSAIFKNKDGFRSHNSLGRGLPILLNQWHI